jgi:hypothetical protein
MYESRTTKPAKIILKGGRMRNSNKEGEFDQSTLFAFLEKNNETPVYKYN